jgi:DNA-binding CsgD family transcriptional regulator/predicted aspartyl protease
MSGPIQQLTPREREVILLLGQGHDAKSIARDLGISVHTVNERLRDVRRKMGVTSSREAARLLSAEASPGGDKNLGPKKMGMGSEASSQHELASPAATGATPRRYELPTWGGIMLLSLAVASLAFFVSEQTGGVDQPDRRRQTRHVAVFSDVAIRFDGSYLRVPAEIGTVRADLILDTAAASMVISPAVRDALGITERKEVNVLGAGGESKYEAVEVPLLRVGGVERLNSGAVVVDLERFRRNPGQPYGGLLGNDFLRDHDVEINIPAGRLRLYKPVPSPLVHEFPESAAVPNLATDPGWIVLEVLINGRPIRAIVDTAASTSVLNWAAAREAGVTTGTAGLRRRERPTGGLGASAAETHLFTFNDIKVGATRFGPADARIADLPVFKALGLGDKPAMLFGLDMLRNMPMLVSYSGKKVYFRPLSR